MRQVLTHPIFLFLTAIAIVVSAWLYNEDLKEKQLQREALTSDYRSFIQIDLPKAALLCGDKYSGYDRCTHNMSTSTGELTKLGLTPPSGSKWSLTSQGNLLTVSYIMKDSEIAAYIVDSFRDGNLNRISSIKAQDNSVIAVLTMPVLNWGSMDSPAIEVSAPVVSMKAEVADPEVDINPVIEAVVIKSKYVQPLKPKVIIVKDEALYKDRQVRVQDRADRINQDRQDRRASMN